MELENLFRYVVMGVFLLIIAGALIPTGLNEFANATLITTNTNIPQGTYTLFWLLGFAVVMSIVLAVILMAVRAGVIKKADAIKIVNAINQYLQKYNIPLQLTVNL